MLALVGRFTDLLFARDANAEPQPMVGFPTGGNSGVMPYGVTTTTAAGLSTVWRCLDVLGSISILPWREHRGTLDLPLSRLTRRPSAFWSRREWVQLVIRTMALNGVCYLLKLEPYDSEGVPLGLWPIPPQIIVPRLTDTYGFTPPTVYIVGRTEIEAENIVPIRRAPLPGTPENMQGLLNLARAQFAEAMAANNYGSRFWQGGGAPTTILETDANLSDPQATQLGNRWSQRRAQGPDHPAILSHGLKARPFGADVTQQAAVEARKAIDAETCRYFGVPARLANVVSQDAQDYKSSQEENIDMLHYTHGNYISAIEEAITDLLPGGRELTIVTSQFTEGTQLARAQAYQLALMPGQAWMSPSEVREAEDLPPMEMLGPDDDTQRPMTPVDLMPQEVIAQALTGRPT